MTQSTRADRNPCVTISCRSFVWGASVTAEAIYAPHVARAQEPLRIGMVVVKQGPFANQGGDIAKGVQFALQEASNKVLGPRWT